MKISFKIEEMLNASVTENLKRIRIGFDNIVRKLTCIFEHV